MGELKNYLELRQKILNDPALSMLMQEYDSNVERLKELLSEPDYDAEEAIRLTNDTEYLSCLIGQNPLYQEYLRVKECVSRSMQERACHFSGCSCAACKAKESSRRLYEENE